MAMSGDAEAITKKKCLKIIVIFLWSDDSGPKTEGSGKNEHYVKLIWNWKSNSIINPSRGEKDKGGGIYRLLNVT